jgi:hypothetical protein
MIGGEEVIDAAGSREVALKYLSGLGCVDKFSDGDIQPHGKGTDGMPGLLFLLAAFE